VLWGEVLIDGHNRYEICSKYDLPFKTVHNDSFKSLEDVLLWMIDNQLGRRSVSDFQRGMLALRKRDIIAARTKAEATPAKAASDGSTAGPATATREPAAGDAPGTPTTPVASRPAKTSPAPPASAVPPSARSTASARPPPRNW
jgi:hypothetical protein